jgi:hypothetical protein
MTYCIASSTTSRLKDQHNSALAPLPSSHWSALRRQSQYHVAGAA